MGIIAGNFVVGTKKRTAVNQIIVDNNEMRKKYQHWSLQRHYKHHDHNHHMHQHQDEHHLDQGVRSGWLLLKGSFIVLFLVLIGVGVSVLILALLVVNNNVIERAFLSLEEFYLLVCILNHYGWAVSSSW